jgi:SOS regulatory protein LexA
MKKQTQNKSTEQYAKVVERFFTRTKRMPSYSEAAQLFGVASKDTAYKIMQQLVRVGAVGKSVGGKIVPAERDITYHIAQKKYTNTDKASYAKGQKGSVMHGALYMLGLVEAGFPTPAEESLREQVSLDDWLIPKRESSFMVRVKGESMRDAGIHDGDMVIAERSMEAKVGSIVIAEMDGEWTLKTLRKDRQGMYLEPANPDFPPIMRPQRSLKISAIVRGVVRKY